MTAPTMPASSDVLTLLEDLIAAARKAGADAADAVVMDGRSISVGWRLGKLQTLESSEGSDIGLRVFVGKRSAIVSSADRRKGALDALVERAVEMARLVPEDPHGGLAAPEQICRDIPKLDLFDPTEWTTDELIAAADTAERAALSVPGVTNSEGAGAGWNQHFITLAASNGFAQSYAVSSSSISVAVLAGDSDSGMERDYDHATAVYAGDLRTPEDVGRTAGRRTVRRLGARRPPTCKAPVVFDARMARGLVGHFLGAISGPSVARETTFLKDAMGEAVFAPGVSIIDDPHRHRGLRSRPVDAEGLATRQRNLIDDGVLTCWLLDLRSARQLGLDPTGHAVRGTSSPPGPSPFNVWLSAGFQSVSELLADIKHGFFVTELFGQGVNGITGDYSRGAAGFWIENGTVTYPVNEVTIAGNLEEMFKSLTPANDLELKHGTDAPTVRIDGMTIAGS